MIYNTQLLNLIGILVLAIFSVEGVAGSEEQNEESIIKQALFLVELLKSDFAKVLRENNNQIDPNATEDTNSTCALPLDGLNSTIAINETSVTVPLPEPSGLPPPPASPPVPQAPGAPPVPHGMPYANWPSIPMPGYPIPPGPGQQISFPDENYRFPYRFNRRRMMPDYDYFDLPNNLGNLRRFNNGPPVDVGNITATTQVQTTTNIPSSTSEATTLNEEGNTTATTVSTTTIAQTNTSDPPTANTSQLLTNKSSPPLTIETSSLTTAHSTISTTTIPPRPLTVQNVNTTSVSTKIRNKVGAKKRRPNSKGNKKKVGKKPHRKEKRTSIVEQLRHKKSSEVKHLSEDVEMSQVASELMKEIKRTKAENNSIIPVFLNNTNSKQNVIKKIITTSTMKIYLAGSSRLPIPFIENNAFCHFHPENPLCGTKM